MTLSGRAALVTGGKRIGRRVAMDLARLGADVALAFNRSHAEADAAVADITALGRRAVAIQANLTDPHACRRLVDDAAAVMGRLDVLVNMASVYAQKPYEDLTEADWHAALAVDLTATHLCCQAALPHMRRAGGGRIVNFSDWVAASHRPRYTGYVPYYVAKSAVIGLTEILALELARDQILVNAVAPGPILPPPGTSEAEQREVERATPLGRWGGEDEIAKAVAFLVETDFVTGEVVRVDGGRHVK
jgi:NAD(P)-dependent dehydrogenase (short-subunit alcohol dehydrogenase family)